MNLIHFARVTICWMCFGLGLVASQYPDMTPRPPSLSGTASVLVKSPSGSIFMGGSFSNAGNIRAQNIARWDGNKWHAVGKGRKAGIQGAVQAVAVVSDDELYVGGEGLQHGRRTFGGLAIWMNRRWETAFSKLDGRVFTIAIEGNDVYIGGEFKQPDNNRSVNLAVWNRLTKSWEDTPNIKIAECPSVRRLLFTDITLFAIASCKSKDGGQRGRLFKRDAASWVEILPDVGIMYSITANSDRLYLSGWFQRLGSSWFNGIAYLNDSGWHLPSCEQKYQAFFDTVPWSSYSTVDVIAVKGSELYLGGMFAGACGVRSSVVVRYDSETERWYALGNGLSKGDSLAFVRAMVIDNEGNLFVGGDFTGADSAGVNSIAKWNGKAWDSLQGGANNQLWINRFYKEHPELRPSIK